MRTFIAIELSDDIRDALAQVQSHLSYASADVKWVAPQNVHLTLKFLGEITEEKAAEVAAALDAVSAETKPFELTFQDIGAFPKIELPKVIWVGLDKGAQESIALAGKIEAALTKIGFQQEARPFAPHLTVGRVRSGKNRATFREKLLNCKLTTGNCQLIRSFILFKSTLTPTGPIYSKLHEAKLAE